VFAMNGWTRADVASFSSTVQQDAWELRNLMYHLYDFAWQRNFRFAHQ